MIMPPSDFSHLPTHSNFIFFLSKNQTKKCKSNKKSKTKNTKQKPQTTMKSIFI